MLAVDAHKNEAQRRSTNPLIGLKKYGILVITAFTFLVRGALKSRVIDYLWLYNVE
jgi:hypothetical protein